jgi:hypothetical protein
MNPTILVVLLLLAVIYLMNLARLATHRSRKVGTLAAGLGVAAFIGELV